MTVLLSILATFALFPYAIAGLIIAMLFTFLLVYSIQRGYVKFKEWKATGFCKHEFELERTNSYGAKAWYKCKHCKTERLR